MLQSLCTSSRQVLRCSDTHLQIPLAETCQNTYAYKALLVIGTGKLIAVNFRSCDVT
jgi:hypothetical protein